MQTILIIKTGALGDVLRTTSILPGLKQAHPEARLEWVTAPAAVDLVRGHAALDAVHVVDPSAAQALDALGEELASTRWDWIISLDDEEGLCALATRLGGVKLSGAHLAADGARAYTPDVGPWFDMGLLSVHGKEVADRLKIENRRSHPEIYAEMLGIPMGRPELRLPDEVLERARARLASCEGRRPRIGLNTGAGGRWTSKQLPVERVLELVSALDGRLAGRAAFVVLGGRDEADRNRELLNGLGELPIASAVLDGGVDNSILEFGGLINELDLLVTSDSLALHIGVARHVPIVAFFAPTSAAEIELYGLGEKLQSESADYCSYAPDADNSSITVERLVAAVQRVASLPSSD